MLSYAANASATICRWKQTEPHLNTIQTLRDWSKNSMSQATNTPNHNLQPDTNCNLIRPDRTRYANRAVMGRSLLARTYSHKSRCASRAEDRRYTQQNFACHVSSKLPP